MLAGMLISLAAAGIIAQQKPVASMFADDQKRHASLAPSFLSVDLPPTKAAAFPAHLYLSSGDLERAFDIPRFRPDAAIMPTNTELMMTAPAPATQRVLIDRVRKDADVMRDLDDQVAARRKQTGAPSQGDRGLLRIGVDTFMAQLPRGATASQGNRAFPRAACFVATDFTDNTAIDRRDLFSQDRLRKGVAECLAALDGAGAQSVVLPLLSAGSTSTQTNDALYEGQRILKECRLINATAGIALGIHDFAAGRRSLREVGVVQWDQEIVGMFKVPEGDRAAKSAQQAYQAYGEQIKRAFRKGLAGEKTTANDVNGSCNAIFDVR
jgi:hypothetical protein